MPRKAQTKIVSGQRGAKDAEDAAERAQKLDQEHNQRVLEASLKAASAPAPTAEELDEEGKLKTPIEFQSRYKEFRLQITSPADIFVPATGQVIKSKPKVAQFHNYTFKTTDAEIVKKIRQYQRFGDVVFETAVVQAAAEKAQVEQILSTISEQPSVRRKVLAALEGRDEFKMPNPKTTPAGA